MSDEQSFLLPLSIDTSMYRDSERARMQHGVSFTQVMGMIYHHEREMALIDTQVLDLQQKARQLQYQKYVHERQIQLCRGVVTLAIRMPHEILVAIFLKCVQDGYTLTPLIASHVCSEWRRAACAPSVWSHIYANCSASNALSRTHVWLRRAQSSLLHITIETGTEGTVDTALMELLLSRSHQWRQFTLRAHSFARANRILASCTTATPELATLNIVVVEDIDSREGSVEDLTISFRDAPRLASTSLTCDNLPAHGALPTSITTLSITFPCSNPTPPFPIARILDVLEALPHLYSLSLMTSPGGLRQFVRPSESTSSTTLGHLRRLTFVGTIDLFQILSFLITPVTTHLHLRYSLDPTGYPLESIGAELRQYLRMSSPPLELLEMHDLDIPFNDLSWCLSVLPSLQVLKLHESELPDRILNSFNGPNGYCPRLHRLSLRWCGTLTGEALVELVRSRLETDGPIPCSPISELTIVHCAFVQERDIYNLTRYVTCKLIQDADDCCFPIGCCRNERYRKRLAQRIHKLDATQRGRLTV